MIIKNKTQLMAAYQNCFQNLIRNIFIRLAASSAFPEHVQGLWQARFKDLNVS